MGHTGKKVGATYPNLVEEPFSKSRIADIDLGMKTQLPGSSSQNDSPNAFAGTVPINAVAASTHLRNVLEERVSHGFSGFSVIHLDEPSLPETAMLVWMLTVPAIMLIPKRRN
ncbi:MAG: hypothetical protein IID38_09085 [Planctomycetes bacterium]|nr:hypothetical protein [Planctomycetota bacterium]